MSAKTALKIDDTNDWMTTYHKLTGFDQEDWEKIAAMSDTDFEEWIIDELDERNDGIGSCWYCGYGIMSISIRQGEYVIIKTGACCD